MFGGKSVKYELTDETINIYGKTLYRIRALKDFSDVNKGELGGYIEKKSNLSQYGNCWVYSDARVFGNAKVYDYAKVFGNARVYGDARVCGNAVVSGNEVVFGNAEVCGDMKKENKNNVITKKEQKMSFKEKSQKLYTQIKPYERYILVAALLIAMDYFIFKGELSGKIKTLATKVSDRFIGILDTAIAKIGGENEQK